MEALLAACCVGALDASVLWRDDYFDPTYDVVADGNTAYVAAGYSGVLVVDVTNPASPTLLGVSTVRVDKLHLAGQVLYALNSDAVLSICDVSDPSAPTVVGTWDCPTMYGCNSLTVEGSMVYVGGSKVYIVDAANPAAPTQVGTYTPLNSARDLYVSGSHLYVAAYTAGLEVADVTDPTAPTFVGSNNSSNMIASGVIVSGTVAYVGCTYGTSSTKGLCTFDVADPSAPAAVGNVEAGDVRSLALDGTTLYAASLDTGLSIIDVSNAASPSVVGSYSIGEEARSVAYVGTTALVVFWKNALNIIDTSAPAAPTLTAEFPKFGSTKGVHAAGTVAAVTDDTNMELRLYNVSDPTAGALLSTLGVAADTVHKPFIHGTHVYVGTSSGLNIVDITDPSTPSLVGSYAAQNVASVWVVGHLAYIVVTYDTLEVVDVSNPASPSKVGSLAFTGTVSDVMVEETTAYVGGASGLTLVDVRNPLDLKLLGSIYVPGTVRDVAVSGTVVYAASGSGGLQVVNVSDPAVLVVLGYYDLDDAYGVSVVGGTAYVADNGREADAKGLSIFNVTTATPVLLGTVETGRSLSVHAVGATAYVGAVGLRIVGEAPEQLTPTPTRTLTLVGYGTPIRELTETLIAPQAQETEPPTPVESPEDEDSEGVPLWVWILGALGALVVVGAAAAAVYFSRRKKPVNVGDFDSTHSIGLVPTYGLSDVQGAPIMADERNAQELFNPQKPGERVTMA